jgi:hypothetical protein
MVTARVRAKVGVTSAKPMAHEEDGRAVQSSSFLRSGSGLLPRAHASDTSSAPSKVTVVVPKAEGFDVAEAGTVHADAPPSNAAIHVVEPIPFHITADACLRAPRASVAYSRGISLIGRRFSQSRLSVFKQRRAARTPRIGSPASSLCRASFAAGHVAASHSLPRMPRINNGRRGRGRRNGRGAGGFTTL